MALCRVPLKILGVARFRKVLEPAKILVVEPARIVHYHFALRYNRLPPGLEILSCIESPVTDDDDSTHRFEGIGIINCIENRSPPGGFVVYVQRFLVVGYFDFVHAS
jgi:hypothetical protein